LNAIFVSPILIFLLHEIYLLLRNTRSLAAPFRNCYLLRTDVGDQKELAILAVHLRSVYRDEKLLVAIADGIWQISDAATKVKLENGKFSSSNKK